MSSEKYKCLIYEKKDKYCIITLNRPKSLNALNTTLRTEIVQVFEDFKNDNNLRVAILTGQGEKAFCVGADLKDKVPTDNSFISEFLDETSEKHFMSSFDTIKPIIAAVNGYAIGGGMELALGADIRIASKNAKFALTEAKIASIPAAGGTIRLPRAIPQAIATKMLLTGDFISASEALQYGLISDLTESSMLIKKAEEIAIKIANNAPLSVKAIKTLLKETSNLSIDSALKMERIMFGNLRNSQDRLEGRKAFSEKRTPNYKGK